MPRPYRLLRTRPAGLALVAAASVAMLSGCTGTTPEPTASAAATTAPATQTAAPEPTETAEPPTPFAIECDALLPAEQLYEFNPNVGAAPGYEPSAAAVVAVVEEDAGTACGFLNQTSGELIEIAVATPTEAAGETRRNDAALSSHPVPTYGTPPDIEGYFTQAGGSGEAQVFHGPYWIVIASPALFEPGDAGQLVSSVLANLPAT